MPIRDMLDSDLFDIAFVGGGFRTTTFLASNPHLLRRRIAIIESRDVGPGAFAGLRLLSSSYGNRFFRDIDHTGEFAWIFSEDRKPNIALANAPIRLDRLAEELQYIGNGLKARYAATVHHIQSTCLYVNAPAKGDSPIEIALSERGRIRCKLCVIASGRREHIHPSLNKFRGKLLLSSELLSGRFEAALRSRMLRGTLQRIVVLGSAQSAFACIERLLKTLPEPLQRRDPPLPDITVLHRSKVRLCYDSQAQARVEQDPAREELFSTTAHVCEETGIVFRDTGLRHNLKQLFIDIWSGRLSNVNFVKTHEIKNREDLLTGADLIVQGLGYFPNSPELRVSGTVVRRGNDTIPLTYEPDGKVLITGSEMQRVAALRLDPTPPELADRGTYARQIYSRLGSSLAAALG